MLLALIYRSISKDLCCLGNVCAYRLMRLMRAPLASTWSVKTSVCVVSSILTMPHLPNPIQTHRRSSRHSIFFTRKSGALIFFVLFALLVGAGIFHSLPPVSWTTDKGWLWVDTHTYNPHRTTSYIIPTIVVPGSDDLTHDAESTVVGNPNGSLPLRPVHQQPADPERLSVEELVQLVSTTEGYFTRDWSLGLGWNNVCSDFVNMIRANVIADAVYNRLSITTSKASSEDTHYSIVRLCTKLRVRSVGPLFFSWFLRA